MSISLPTVPTALRAVVSSEIELFKTDDELIKYSMSEIKVSFKKTLYETLKIGFYLEILKTKCEHGAYLNNLKQVGVNARAAQQYVKIYKAFSALDTKKALKSFEQLQFSKLRELASLSKEALNNFAKNKAVIEMCQSATTKEFKQQLLPGIKAGKLDDLQQMQGEIDVLHQKLDAKNNTIAEQDRRLRDVSGNKPSDIVIIEQTCEITGKQIAVSDITQEIASQFNDLKSGKLSFLLNGNDPGINDLSRTKLLHHLQNSVTGILADAQSLYQLYFSLFEAQPKAGDDIQFSTDEIVNAKARTAKIKSNMNMSIATQKGLNGV